MDSRHTFLTGDIMTSNEVLFKIWSTVCFVTYITTHTSDATTATPVPVYQVTPPSPSNLAVTSQPSLYHDSSNYESSKSSAERHISVATWNNTHNVLRESSVRLKSNQPQANTESGEQKDYLSREYNIRNHREDGRGKSVHFNYFPDAVFYVNICL